MINESKTVLLVEDDDALALIETKILIKLSFYVIRSSSGESAINIIKTQNTIDLILLDIDLGVGIDGPTTAKSILLIREIPIIFLSSHTEIELINYTQEICAYGYLHKSATLTIYSFFVQNALKLFKINQEIKKNNKVLSAKIKQFDTLVLNTPAAIAVFDTDMKYLSASKQFYIDYQIPESNIIGKSHYEVFPEISKRIKDIHQRCLNGETLSDHFSPFFRSTRTFDFIKWEMRPWYNEDGNIAGVILFSVVLNKFIEEYKKYNQEVMMLNATNDKL